MVPKKEPEKRDIKLSKSTMFSILFGQKILNHLFQENPYVIIHADLKFRNLAEHPENTASKVTAELLIEYCELSFNCHIHFGVEHLRKIEGRYRIDNGTEPNRRWVVLEDMPIFVSFQNENMISLLYVNKEISPDTLWDEELLLDLRKRLTTIFGNFSKD